MTDRVPDVLPVLSRGKHRSPKRGACFMEMASYLAGERWSDSPSCTHPLLAAVARAVNDHVSDAGRAAIAPLIPSVIGLTSDDARLDAELALVCDLLVAGEGATFGVPEVKRGLLAAGGALIRLASRLPYAVAMEMSLTGDPIDSDAAQRYGLVSTVVPQEQVLDEAIALAERIAANAPLSIAASKQMIRNSVGRTEAEGWAEQGPLAGKVFSSKDSIEGSIAFAEKRTPNWQGA